MNKRFLIFIFFFIFLIALGSYTSITVLGNLNLLTPALQQILIGISIVFPLLFILSMFFGNKKYTTMLSYTYTLGALWLGILLYLFLATTFLSLIFFINNIFVLQINMFPVGVSTIAVISILFLYGIIRAHIIALSKYTISSNPLDSFWNGKKIIIISDIHLGLTRGRKFLDKIVTKINIQNPDLILIVGDVLDGPVIPYENFLEPLKKIKSTYGTYYTPGNHEKYNSEPEKFFPQIKKVTKTLIDEKDLVNNTQIIGLDYKINESSEELLTRLEKIGFNTEFPSIALLHDPKHAQILQDKGISLIVSGHTHAGQFWPITWIVKLLYGAYAYGQTTRGASIGITTSGIGTAVIPIRVGTRPEIVSIEFN